MTRLGPLLLALVALCSCTKSGSDLSVRLAPYKKVFRARADASGLACYFASVRGARPSTKTPPCLGLGNTSRLMTYEEITTSGASMKVPIAAKLDVKIFAVSSSTACSAASAAEDLFLGGLRPEIFEIGSTETSLNEQGELLIPNTYDPDRAYDLGGCDAGVSNMTVAAISPDAGLHRGGVAVSILGTNFQDGSTVRIGGVPCENVVVVSDIAINCVTPETPMKLADVVVRDPRGATQTKVGGFKAFAMIYAIVAEGGIPSIKVLKHDPVTGVSLLNTHTATPLMYGANLHPSGKWLVPYSNTSGEVISWFVNHISGDVSEITTNAVSNPMGVVFHPNGNFLYVGISTGDAYICPFDMDDGSCGSSTAVSFSGVGSLHDIGISPSGGALFARMGSASYDIRSLLVSANGSTLSSPQAATSSYTTFARTFYNPVLPAVMMHQDDVAAGDFRFFHSIGDGTLTYSGETFTTALTNLSAHNFTKAGDGLYLMSPGPPPTVRFYRIESSGFAQDSKVDFVSPGSPSKFTTDWYGKYLYIVHGGASAKVSFYETEPATGMPPAAANPQDTAIGSSIFVYDVLYN